MKAFLALLLVLTSCAAQSPAPLTSVAVLPPGHQVLVGAEQLRIFGTDPCPTGDPAMEDLFGTWAYAGKNECVVLSHDKSEVVVRVATSAGLTTEVWKVSHDSTPGIWGMSGGRTWITRP